MVRLLQTLTLTLTLTRTRTRTRTLTPHQVTSFKENAHALEEWQRCLAEDRAALSEMQARQ